MCWGELPYFLEAADTRLSFLETTCGSLVSIWMTRWGGAVRGKEKMERME